MKHLFCRVLLAALIVTAAADVNAQRVKYPSFHMGLRLGYSSNNGYLSNVDFVHGGVNMDFRLGRKPLYLETGLYFMDKGYYSIGSDTWNRNEEIGHDCFYLYLPLLISYHFYVTDHIAIQPFTGITVGWYNGPGDGDASYRLGVGANWKRLYLNVGYDFGLGSHSIRSNNEYVNFSNNTFFVSLGFNFAGRR